MANDIGAVAGEESAVEVSGSPAKDRKMDVPMWDLPGHKVMEITNALVSLVGRALPTVRAEMKSAYMLDHFRPHAKIIEDLNKKNELGAVQRDDESGEEKFRSPLDLATKTEEIRNALFHIPVIKARITEEDLPKAGTYKDKDLDAKNRAGIAEIRSALMGTLYALPDDFEEKE